MVYYFSERTTVLMLLISFLTGALFGYHLQTWRVQRIKRQEDNLRSELRQIQDKLNIVIKFILKR